MPIARDRRGRSGLPHRREKYDAIVEAIKDGA
jgi:hypothetical protein